MLNERAKILLKTLVERYIEEGQPVGSRTLSRYSGLDLSPASIRNVMADLEEMGLITSPHTSAGRIPTPLGYRLFVDTLIQVKPLEQLEISQLQNTLSPDDPTRLVNAASQMLSELTSFAGIVAIPKTRGAVFRQLEFMRLASNRLLLILVTDDGEVQNRVIVTDKDYTPAQLVEAANYFNRNFAGQSLTTVSDKIREELSQLHQDIAALVNVSLTVGEQTLSAKREEYVISGERKLLHSTDLAANITSLRKLFDVFEQKTQLLEILDQAEQAQGVKIFIGGESGTLPLDECSFVTAPYEVNGLVVGTLGVVGPSRMAYERVIPIVDITARLLSNALSYH